MQMYRHEKEKGKTMNYILIFDVIMAAVGIYFGIAAIQMKRSGEISNLIASQEEIKRCKHKEAFDQNVSPKLLIFAGIAIALGIASFVNDLRCNNGTAYYALRAVFLLNCSFLIAQIRKERRGCF